MNHKRLHNCLSTDVSFFLFFFFHTLLLSSFWTSHDHRCRPFSPRLSPSNNIAHKVQQSRCSSIFHRVLPTHALARGPQVNLFTRKSPYGFIQVCIRGDSNSQNWPIIPGSRIIRYVTGATMHQTHCASFPSMAFARPNVDEGRQQSMDITDDNYYKPVRCTNFQCCNNRHCLLARV